MENAEMTYWILVVLLAVSNGAVAWLWVATTTLKVTKQHQRETISELRAEVCRLESGTRDLTTLYNKEGKLRIGAEQQRDHYADLLNEIHSKSCTDETLQAHENVRDELGIARRAVKTAVNQFDKYAV